MDRPQRTGSKPNLFPPISSKSRTPSPSISPRMVSKRPSESEIQGLLATAREIEKKQGKPSHFIQIYQRLAKDENAEAIYRLAEIWLSQGQHSNAFECMKRAAEQEHALARCRLAEMYRYGIGPTQNNAEAIKWFEEAYSSSDSVPRAYMYLGVMYNAHRDNLAKIQERNAHLVQAERSYLAQWEDKLPAWECFGKESSYYLALSEEDPIRPLALYLMGEMYLAKGNKNHACAYFNEVEKKIHQQDSERFRQEFNSDESEKLLQTKAATLYKAVNNRPVYFQSLVSTTNINHFDQLRNSRVRLSLSPLILSSSDSSDISGKSSPSSPHRNSGKSSPSSPPRNSGMSSPNSLSRSTGGLGRFTGSLGRSTDRIPLSGRSSASLDKPSTTAIELVSVVDNKNSDEENL